VFGGFGGDGTIFDSSAVHHALTGKTLYAGAVIVAAQERGRTIVIPSTALLAGAARVDDSRGYRRRALDVLLGLVPVVVEVLDTEAARAAADLLAAADPAGPPVDVVAAHAVLVARQRGWKVATDRPEVLRALDAAVRIDPLP
jgi:hypothetical protein